MRLAVISTFAALCSLLSLSATAQSSAGSEPAPGTHAETELEIVTVLGTRDRLDSLPGSHQVIAAEELNALHVMTTSEALRKAAGINVRDEEGFGLRPNIGLRGLNPTRSTKMLLLEDGIPMAYAPYGDNASYYHPPIDRFSRVEVLKGAGVNLYGPQTVGGVINYITPTPPEEFAGLVRVTGGNRDYSNVHGRVGARGFQFDFVDKRGDGARDHLHSGIQDYNAKWLAQINDDHTLILRANHYVEDSDLTYSGLTDAELANFGHRYNPFHNDIFNANRSGASATHDWRINPDVTLTTNLYWSRFSRDWWRQSSTTTDTQCDLVLYDVDGVPMTFTQARAAGFAVDPDDCNSRQGRLRDYYSVGVEPRLQVAHTWFGVDSELTVGARYHVENQKRRQVNSAAPNGKTGVIAERNERDTEAWAVFLQNRFILGDFELVPGIRAEYIENERENVLVALAGDADVNEWLPSLGASYRLSDRVTLYAGVHKGFSPPRTEDIIDNSGVVTDVNAEESINIEAGLRARPADGVTVEATYFRTEFDDQIVVGSIAGGSTPLAEGESLYEGMELTLRAARANAGGLPWTPYMQLAYTFLPTADIESPFLQVVGGLPVPGAVTGNRLPYAPEHLLTLGVGADLPHGFDVHVELVFVDDQYADFANTPAALAGGNGQFGRITDYHIWNASLNWHLPQLPVTLFVTAKNLADKDYIVDRTRGIQTAVPLLVQGGIEFRF